MLLDIKSFDPAIARRLTGGGIAPTLAFARRLADRGQPVWVRFVLVPGWTDDPGDIAALAPFAASLGNVERVDVLPFHTLGAPKYSALGLDYPCGAVVPPSADQVRRSAPPSPPRGCGPPDRGRRPGNNWRAPAH